MNVSAKIAPLAGLPPPPPFGGFRPSKRCLLVFKRHVLYKLFEPLLGFRKNNLFYELFEPLLGFRTNHCILQCFWTKNTTFFLSSASKGTYFTSSSSLCLAFAKSTHFTSLSSLFLGRVPAHPQAPGPEVNFCHLWGTSFSFFL